jgi:hypothetical protein
VRGKIDGNRGRTGRSGELLVMIGNATVTVIIIRVSASASILVIVVIVIRTGAVVVIITRQELRSPASDALEALKRQRP